jgi:5-methylcytosine-specific restriction endonuclease McrA
MNNCQYCGEPTGKKRKTILCRKCDDVFALSVQLGKVNTEIARSKLKNVECDLTIQQWMTVINHFTKNEGDVLKITCVYCGRLFPPNRIGIDHFIPMIIGGKTTLSNCVPSCYVCNTMKGALTGTEFLGLLSTVWRSPQAADSYLILIKYLVGRFDLDI